MVSRVLLVAFVVVSFGCEEESPPFFRRGVDGGSHDDAGLARDAGSRNQRDGGTGRPDAAPYRGDPDVCTGMCARIYDVCGFRFGDLTSTQCALACVAGDFGGSESCLSRVSTMQQCVVPPTCKLSELGACTGQVDGCALACDRTFDDCNTRHLGVCISNGVCRPYPQCGLHDCLTERNNCYSRC